MKKYNFDKIINRRSSSCVKWCGCEKELPMWIADMDFETLPEVIDAVRSKAAIGAYGYTMLPKEYFSAYTLWWKDVHNVSLKEEWMIFSNGVVAALSSIIRHVTNVGDQILIQSPVYNCFYSSILDNNRKIISSDLVYENVKYHIDFKDLEQKLSNPKTVMMIICNPHNPIGNAWTKEELTKIADLCIKYNVMIISDEIHCDFVNPNESYVPFFSLDKKYHENAISCISTSKMFNLAGLKASCIIVPNKELFDKVSNGINVDHVGSPNYFAVEACIAALTYGKEWVKELNEYIYENKQYVLDYVKENNLDIHIVPSNSTYLLWIDFSKYTSDSEKFTEDLRKETGLYLCSGLKYGQNGKSFARMNVATPRVNVVDAMARLDRFLKELK